MLIIFIYIAINAFMIENNYIDNLFDFSLKHLNLFRTITRIGDWYVLIFFTILSGIFFGKKYFKYVSINLATITFINQMLKIILRRSRPINNLNIFGYSFPSGHAMVSMAYYGFIIYLILKANIKNKYKIASIIILSLIIFLIGFSRIYLGVHYLTDILGGFTLSILYLAIYTYIIERKNLLNEN